MKYPNAAKGLHYLVVAEIVALVASVIAVIVSVFALPNIDVDNFFGNVISTRDIIMMLLILVLYLAAFVLEIVGIVLASKDEPAFKISLYAIIAAIILTILSAFFYQNETVDMLISIGGDVAQFFLVHYIIHGIMHISEHLGRHELSKRGSRIFVVIYIGIIFEIIVRVLEIIFGKEQGETLALPFDVIANILKSAEYILFLIYIVKGSKLLRKTQAESEPASADQSPAESQAE